MTKEFYEHGTRFIKNLDLDIEEKNDLLNALTTYLKVDNSSKISSENFASTYLSIDTQDDFKSYMTKSGLPNTAFLKDLKHIESKIKYRKIEFRKDVRIIGSPEVFKDYVTIESISGDKDESGESQKWTKITIKDRAAPQG